MKTNNEESYPGFEHPSCLLSKFHTAGDIFTILLKDGSIIHYTPNDLDTFKEWLLKNGVSDIRIKSKT